MKKSITSSEKFQKFNRKIVEIGKFDIPNTRMYMTAHFPDLVQLLQ